MKQLRNYQQELVEKGLNEHHYYVLPCGAGKTITAIETVKGLRALAALPHKAALIIVSPKLATLQWANVIADQDPEASRVIVLERDGSVLNDVKEREPLYVVTHYEGLVKHISKLEKIRFLVVIADEAHNLRNADTQRTMSVKRLKAIRKIAMSGTPTDKSQAELFPVLQWFDSATFSSYWRFVDTHFLCALGFNERKIPTAIKDKEAFRELISPYVTAKSRHQVSSQLQKRQVTIHRIPLLPAQRKAYDEIRKAKDIEVVLDEFGLLEPLLVPSVIAQLVRLQQVASLPSLLKLTAPSAKIEWIREFVKDNRNEQMLIFTRFREAAIYLAGLLNAALVVGGQTLGFDEFVAGRRKLLVGTIDAMGTALDLPMANITIFMDCTWSSIKMRQAKDRMRDATRVQKPKQLIYLVADRTVDGLIMQALAKKFTDQQLATALLTNEDDNAWHSVTDDEIAAAIAT